MTFPLLAPDRRRVEARLALRGLSIGDAFGETFFVTDDIAAVAARRLAPAPWPWTDDTHMALSVVEVLERHGTIDRDALATAFARRHAEDPMRGYGATARTVLREIAAGTPWQQCAPQVFGGLGSMGNGAAMRAAPIGGYFADDPTRAGVEAVASAQPTHAHIEGASGAAAVAIAAAFARRARASGRLDGNALLRATINLLPPGAVREGIEKACELGLDASLATAVAVLGNGTGMQAPDTVPFALWCAARHLGDFQSALWTTVSALGDRDTTCAIVGGIVALAVGELGIPDAWLWFREPLEPGFELTPFSKGT